MPPIPNPPLFKADAPPAPLQVLRLNAAGDAWEPATIATAGITVPQASLADTSAPVALTAATVATPNAADQSALYVEADVDSIATLANALKVALNAAIADSVAIRAELATLTVAHNALISRLETASILVTV